MTETLQRDAEKAEEGQNARESAEASEFLAFRLATEDYALPLASIQEILKVPLITEVPGAPSDLLGVISVRGRITTVIDLRRRLHLPGAPWSTAARILLVEHEQEVFGLLIDEVQQVYRLKPDELEIVGSMSSDTADYVAGLGRPNSQDGSMRRDTNVRSERMLILLNASALLRK